VCEVKQPGNGGPDLFFSYTYDLMGSLKNETYPSGRVITTEYDGAERASSVAGDLASLKKNYATQASYVPHGGIRALPMGNNVWQVYSYNSRLQVQRIEDAVNNDPSQVLFDQHFEWGTSDNNGNLQSVVTNHGGPGYPQFLTFKEYYGYDPLNRVLGSYGKDINENLLWGQNFSYDRYGNAWTPSAGGLPISGLTPTTNVYNTANRMNATTYDAAGNQTVVGAYALVYDAENRQKQSTDSTTGAIVGYQYDGDGRRVEKTLGSNETVYVYDAFRQLAAEYANGSAGTPPCQTCYLSTDHLGNTRLVTDGSANVIARHDFTPFGEEIPAGYAARNTQWGAFDGVRQKFTGQEHDDENQFDFFQARYLSAAQQRFMSPDPANAGADLMNPQSWNGYAYVNNNPLNAIDPTGTCSIGPDGVAHDDDPGDCGGGGITVPGGSPDPVPLDPDPCIYFECGSGGGYGNGQFARVAPQPVKPQQPPKNGTLTQIKNLACSAIPDARTLTLSGGIGAVGSTQGSLQASLDYRTGRTSFSASGGFQLGWNGVASAQVSTGFVYGSSNSNRSVSYSGGTAISGYMSTSGNAREYGIGFGVSLTEGVGGGRTVSLSTPSVGNLPGLETPLDSLLILAKQVCQ
jgi:RHS repeat-associated protein